MTLTDLLEACFSDVLPFIKTTGEDGSCRRQLPNAAPRLRRASSVLYPPSAGSAVLACWWGRTELPPVSLSLG